MLCSLRFVCTMELCGQSTTPTETYEVSGSEIGEAYLHIRLSRAIVLLGLGSGLCVTYLNHKDKLTWLSILFALVCFSQHLLQVPRSTFSPVWSSMIAFAMFLYILGMLFTSCFHSRIQLTSKNRRRTTLGSHIWTRRKIFWRHARLSRESYIRHAMNNKLEALFGRCNLSCSKISKSLCGKTNPCSTPIATLSGKTKRVRICKKGRSTVKLYPFITNTKRVKKRIHFRRKSGSSSCRSVLGAIVSDAKVHVITKKKSKRKKASSLVGQIPTKRISADDKEHDVGPAYHITPTQVENVYKAMRKGRSFSASKRVLWRNRHRLVLRREEQEDPHMHQTGKEYSSNNGGDGPHSSEEYDPEIDAIRTRKRQLKKGKQNYRKKRRNVDGRSLEYEVRSKRRRVGDVSRAREIKRKSQRRQAGEISRAGEIKRKSERRQAGDISLAGDIKRKSERRQAGDIIRDRTWDIERQSERRRERNIIPSDSGSIWTADAVPTDKELKQFVKDPYTAVAAFRLMAGIPADPRIASANLDFDVDEEHIISRFSDFCGHEASIKICGSCGVGDIMAGGEFYELPLTHTRVTILICDKEKLERLPEIRRESMHLLKRNGKVYHLDIKAFNEEDETFIVCTSCYNSLAYANRTGKPPVGTFAFYDYGIVPANLPKLSFAEEIATSVNIVIQVIVNLKPLAGVSQTAAKGHAIAVPLTGVQSLATVVYDLPRQDLSEHISLVVVAKKDMWKAMRRLLRRKGPLTCNPRHILYTLLYRKAVKNKNYEHVRIPKPQDMERIACDLNKQLENLIHEATFSDSMIADELLQRQRIEVEDEQEGFNNSVADDVFIKGVLLTEAPNVANPMAHVLESLLNKLDETVEEVDAQGKCFNIASIVDVSGSANGDVSSRLQPSHANVQSSNVQASSRDGVKRTHKVHVLDKVINEFEDNPELIGGAFATLLPLGFTKDDIGKGGTLPKKLIRTWLLSHDRRFAEHHSFNHFIFNQNIRHETNSKVSMRVKGNDKRTRKLLTLVNEDDFQERLRMAVNDPKGQEAREISKTILPFLKIVGSKVRWSCFERSNALTHLYAMNQFFGLSFLFVTISPSMRNSPLAIRMCYCSLESNVELPDLQVRTKLLVKNPVLAARVYHRLIRAFFEIICGMPLSHFTGRKTNVDRLLSKNRDCYIGAFGRLKGVYSVTEEQTGGSLHMHGQLFGMIDQRVLSRWIHYKDFRKDVCKFMDSIVTTEVPADVVRMSQQLVNYVPVPSQPYPSVEDIPLDSAFCRLRLNSHRHCFTCWKGECLTCRMAYPRQFALRSYVAHIVPDPNNPNEIVPIRRFPTDSSGDEIISEPPQQSDNSPIDPVDPRCLASGLKRTSKIEQMICESNPLTTVLLRCNTSIQPTIAPTAARNAVFYSSKYCSKNPYKLSSTLSLLYTAQLALRKYGSVAQDAGTKTRNTKCLMQKLLHKTGLIEVGAQQAAAANLGYNSFFSSHNFCYIFIWDAVRRLRKSNLGEEIQHDNSDSEDLEYVLETDMEGNFFSIAQFDKYIWRSTALSLLNLYDYACCITHNLARKKRQDREVNSNAGRKKLKRYPFEGSGCKFPETLTQTVATSLKVPILAGAPPPGYPGDKPADDSDDEDIALWEKNARTFVEYYSMLFLPFDHNMDPRDPTLPHLAVLPWNSNTSWDNFTTIFKSWDVDTDGTGDKRSWYKRSTYRLFHNLVHSFKQPKLTRTLLAKWRALSADKRPTLDCESERMGSSKDNLWVRHSSDDEDSCDGAVAVVEMLRDHFGAADKKVSRSELNLQKEVAFLGFQTGQLNNLTLPLRVDPDGQELKCSEDAAKLSKQPYSSMTVQDASDGFSKLQKGISLDEIIDDNELDEEEFDIPAIPDNNVVNAAEIINDVDPVELPVSMCNDTGLPKNYKLTDSQIECVAEMRKEMEKGQMLVFVHGPPGSGKTTTARLLVSEKNLDLVFSGTTGTASSLYKAETINSLLHLGRNVEDFQPSKKRLSAQAKSEILSKFGDARILVLDEVSMCNPVMFALIDLRLRQCFNPQKPFGGLHVILLGDMYQFPPIGRKLKKPALYQAAVLCSRYRKLPNMMYRSGANLFTKFRLLKLKGQERADEDFDRHLKPLRDTSRKRPITKSWLQKLPVLTTADILKDSSWAFTTIAVTGNNERLAITAAQAERFGWVRNEPILQWICPVRKKQRRKAAGNAGHKTSGKASREAIYTNLDLDPALFKGKFSHLRCFFVRGAPCVLSENLCTTLGYAKGKQGVFESVVWDPTEGEVPDINSLPRGVITTVMQPKFILVRVDGKLIPIGTCNARIETRRNQKVRKTNFRKHPVDLLFAVTYHKLQGVTLEKLILSINKHPNYLLRLALSSLYVGLSRVKKLEDIRVLPYRDKDVDYLVSLQFDDLLKAWINNYTKDGHWKYDGFKTFEQKMLEKTKLDLGLVDDLALLTIQECKVYLSKLDLIATGTKVSDLRSALSESYSQGRDILNAGSGKLLIRQRISLYRKLKKLGDYRRFTLSRLRYYAKRLGICKSVNMRKSTIISALKQFEATHCAGMFDTDSNTHAAGAGTVLHNLQHKDGFNVSGISGDTISGMRKRQKRNLPYARDDSHLYTLTLTRRCKGLVNPNNRCYFNSVMQCLNHCPTVRKAIEILPQHVFSINVLREILLLFNRMNSDDVVTYISPSDCFATVINTRQCKSVQMGLDDRQEDVHEFLSKLIEHIDEEILHIADTYNLPTIFDIILSSAITCRGCLRSIERKEYLTMLSLHFPDAYSEPAQDSVSHALHINSLIDSYFKAEILNDHRCEGCDLVGATDKKLNLINTPQVFVVHLSRFANGLQKLSSFVEFPRELCIVHLTDGIGQQLRYRLTGVICHEGSSIARGHYVSYLLIDGNWYKADDKKIAKVTWEAVRRLQVYMLFFDLLQ